jgi:hypothetical protein
MATPPTTEPRTCDRSVACATADAPPETSQEEREMPDYDLARAICADCHHYLWFSDSLDLDGDSLEDGWVDEVGRPTCYYRETVGHVPVAIGSELPPLSPASLTQAPATSVAPGVFFS